MLYPAFSLCNGIVGVFMGGFIGSNPQTRAFRKPATVEEHGQAQLEPPN